MVGRQTLDLLIMVRVHASEQIACRRRNCLNKNMSKNRKQIAIFEGKKIKKIIQ